MPEPCDLVQRSQGAESDRQLAELGADNDALRADLDAVLAELDAVRADRDRHRTEAQAAQARTASALAELEAVVADRDAVAADREILRENLTTIDGDRAAVGTDRETLRAELAAVVADREALRADLAAVMADREQVLADREQELAEFAAVAADRDAVAGDRERLRAELEEVTVRAAAVTDRSRQAIAAATAHRRGRAAAVAAAYATELQEQARARFEAVLQNELRGQHQFAVKSEDARHSTAAQVAFHGAVLRETQATLSWRLTRPLRAVRRAQLRVRSLWQPDRARAAGPPPIPAVGALPAIPDFQFDERVVDPTYYRLRYPDLQKLDDIALDDHFHRIGQQEGRVATSWLRRSLILTTPRPDERPRILVLLPDAGLTGTPALGLSLITELSGRYHVVAVLAADGDLTDAIADVADTTVVVDPSRDLNPQEAAVLALELQQWAGPEFAVANSVACHVLATALEEAGVPVVALVHEFARAAEPLVDLNPFFAGMSAVVYSDALIAEAMAEQFVAACGRGQVVAAQGHAELPGWVDVGRAPLVVRTGFDGLLLELPEIALEDLLGTLDPAAVLIVGVGALCAGQGVEFFLEAAG